MKIEKISVPNYEEVYHGTDDKSGLNAFISVHSTRLGPSLGGIRLWNYESEDEALFDALRLSKAMTYKAASADLKLGGGKAVIISDPRKPKSEELLRAMGQFVNTIEGRYLAAEDASITPDDLAIIQQETSFVTGTHEGSGDPSPVTAEGVFKGMQICAEKQLGHSDFSRISVAIQGVGHVGSFLVEHLIQAGAKVTITDVQQSNIDAITQKFPVTVVSPEEIFRVEADIFSPCALGGVLTAQNIPHLPAKIIAGASNNQLADGEQCDFMLNQENKLYAPDYVINAGGVINIYVIDILKETNVAHWLELIPKNLSEIFSISEKRNIPPGQAANELVEERLKSK